MRLFSRMRRSGAGPVEAPVADALVVPEISDPPEFVLPGSVAEPTLADPVVEAVAQPALAEAPHGWQLPGWLIETSGCVLVALIVNVWVYAYAGAPRCDQIECSFFQSTSAWTLLLLALTLLVLGFMGLVPAVWECRRARREQRALGTATADLVSG
jgi:hypothetical protein